MAEPSAPAPGLLPYAGPRTRCPLNPVPGPRGRVTGSRALDGTGEAWPNSAPDGKTGLKPFRPGVGGKARCYIR